MMNVLQLKSWQVFILCLVFLMSEELNVPYAGEAGIIAMLSSVYYTAYRFDKRLPDDRKMNFRRFNFAFFYVIGFFATVASLLRFNPSVLSGLHPLITTIALFTMVVSLIYVMLYISKSITTLQHIYKGRNNQRIRIGEDILYFIMVLYYFPIGVWFIQPILNREFADNQPALEI